MSHVWGWEMLPASLVLKHITLLCTELDSLHVMAYLHFQIRTRIQTWIWTSKANGYIALCRSFHTTHIQIPILTANYRNGIWIRVRTRVRPLQCKRAISTISLSRTRARKWKCRGMIFVLSITSIHTCAQTLYWEDKLLRSLKRARLNMKLIKLPKHHSIKYHKNN